PAVSVLHSFPTRRSSDLTQLAYKITGVRFLGEDTAVVTTRGDTYTDKPPRKLTKVQTYTLVREPDGQWEIDVFQNTKRKRWMELDRKSTRLNSSHVSNSY